MAAGILLPWLAWGGQRASRLVKTYPGPYLARGAVALVSRTLVLVEADQVDGKEVPRLLRLYADHFELQPGSHTLRLVYQMVGVSGANIESLRDVTIRFEVEAGRSYSLEPNLTSQPAPTADDPTRTEYTWSPKVVDITESSHKENVKLRERAEKAFRDSRDEPLGLPASPQIVLVNLHELAVDSLDGDGRKLDAGWDFLHLTPGRHSLVVSSPTRPAQAPTSVDCVVEPGRTYALSQGGSLAWDPWKPAVLDITPELDNVKQSLVPKIQRFLKK